MVALLLVSLALGVGSALFPPLNIEAYLVGLASQQAGLGLWSAVLAVTAGHMAGKVLFYALGRGWLARGLPAWVSRRHRLERVPAGAPAGSDDGAAALAVAALPVTPRGGVAPSRWRRWSARLGLDRVEAVAGRPWATALLCFSSASVGLPPFAVMAVLLGRLRMPLLSFLVVGGLGRLLRFGAVAGAGGLVLG